MAVGDLKIVPDNHQHPFPPDLRSRRDTLNERDIINSAIRWDGMPVYVVDEKKWYYLKGGLTNEFWVEIGSGGDSVGNAVQYIAQALTQEQQAQARANIGAAAILDGIISLGAVTSLANDVTIASALWRINGLNYGQTSPTTIAIPVPTAGTTRRDIIVGNTSAGMVLVQGVEAPSGEVAIAPDVPADTILLVETLSNDAGLDQVIEAALATYVRFDIGTQGLSPYQRKNARDNIQAVSKDTFDTRTGGLTQTGDLLLLTGEDGSASNFVFRTRNTKGGGVRVERRGGMTVYALGDSTTDYHIIRGQDATGEIVFEVRSGGVTKGGDAVNNDDFVTLGQMLGAIPVESITYFSDEDFYTAPQTIEAEEQEVTFIKTDKDIVYPDGGPLIVYPDRMANLIFTGPAVELRGIGYAYDGNEVTVENKTNENLIVADNYISAPANTEFNLGGTNLTVLPNTKVAFKASNNQWIQSLNVSSTTFSDTLNSLHAVRSVGSDGLEVISNIQDKNTGEDVTFKELTSTPSTVDGIVYAEVDSKYFKRDTPFGVNVKWFGAKGDGINDDTDAIQAAVQHASVFFPKTDSSYRTTDTINVPSSIKILTMDSAISIDAVDVPAMVIGAPGETIGTAILKIEVVRAVVSDWTNENSIGVKIINANTCDISNINSIGNTIGVMCMGDSGGFVHNKITLGSLLNNKIGIDLTNNSTSGLGWCNDNSFYKGKFLQFNETNLGKERIGVRITSQDGGYLNNNKNVFHDPSFELKEASADPESATPVLIEHGQLNFFHNCRHEGNGEIFIRTLNDSQSNYVDIGFGPTITSDRAVEDLGNHPSTYLINRVFDIRDSSPRKLVYESGDLSKRVSQYDATTVYLENELFGVISSNSGVYKSRAGITRNEEGILLSGGRGIAVRVSTTVVKRFVINRVNNINSVSAGRTAIRCYDALGNILTGTDPYYVKGLSSYTPAYNTNFGGCYQNGVDTSAPLYIKVDPLVAYIDVILYDCWLNSFSIESIYGLANIINPFSRNGLYAVIKPTSTDYDVNTVIFNDDPANKIAGWMHIGSGAWESFGRVSDNLDNILFDDFLSAQNVSSIGFDLNTLTDGFIKFNSFSSSMFTNAPHAGYWIFKDVAGIRNTSKVSHVQTGWTITGPLEIWSRSYDNGTWTSWRFIGGKKPEITETLANSDLSINASNYYYRYTGPSGSVTINADLFSAGDIVEGEIEVGNKTFVGGVGVTLRYSGSNIVQANQRFTIKFKTANDALLIVDDSDSILDANGNAILANTKKIGNGVLASENWTQYGNGATIHNVPTGQQHIFQQNGTTVAGIDGSGKLYVEGIGEGIILKSPDGTQYELTVANGGTTVWTAI